MPEIRHREGRQAMNSFTLGKLAEIRIQTLVEGADQVRTARRAASQRRAPRRKHHFDGPKRSVDSTSLCGAMSK